MAEKRFTGTTKSGFEFSIVESVLDDMELVDLLAEADDNFLLFPKILEKLLGKDQKKKFYDHIKKEHGRVPIEEATKELQEIFNLCNAKNS
ncbi:hypothetical protein ACTQZS_14850 [Bilifractor sp. LCP19S3_H10]|uniref:hypothetical protein n=1 Tax=Bilifractor sp. LCP19S3_H10 TaxID=3438736 RepID=UPI003F8E238C